MTVSYLILLVTCATLLLAEIAALSMITYTAWPLSGYVVLAVLMGH